jgi:hypothetical protein
MEQIVLNMMLCLAPKGRYETDPYGGIEMVVCCRGWPCVCPGVSGDVVVDDEMIGEMVG